jgi:hypothetical protein
LLVVSGCSATADGTTVNAPPTASAEQIAALEDNVVTEDEYDAGWRRFVACLADNGYTVMDLGKPSSVHEGGIPDAAVRSGADEECYAREYSEVDRIWQTNNPPRTIVSDWLIACLTEAGIDDTSGNEEELKQRMKDSGLDVGECIEAKSGE